MKLSKKKGGGSTQVQPCLTILGPNSLWAIWWIWCSSPLWQSWWPNKHQVHLQPNNRNPVLWFCVWGHECRHHCESRNRSPVLGNIQVIVVSLNQKSNTCFPKEGMNISIKESFNLHWLLAQVNFRSFGFIYFRGNIYKVNI